MSNFELCCTAKLLKEFGLKRDKTPPPQNAADPLTQWYAHLFYFDRRKCLVIFNPATGWNLFCLFYKRDDIKQIPVKLKAMITESLARHGFDSNTVTNAFDGFSGAEIRKTNNRSSLAVINQLIYTIPDHWTYPAGMRLEDIESAWACGNNFGPCAGNYRWAYEEMAKVLGVEMPPKLEAFEFVKSFGKLIPVRLDASGTFTVP